MLLAQNLLYLEDDKIPAFQCQNTSVCLGICSWGWHETLWWESTWKVEGCGTSTCCCQNCPRYHVKPRSWSRRYALLRLYNQDRGPQVTYHHVASWARSVNQFLSLPLLHLPWWRWNPHPSFHQSNQKNTQAIQPKLKWKLRLGCRCMERPGLGTRLNGQGLNFRLRVVWKVASSTYTSTNWMSKWCKSYAKIQVCDIHVENLQLDYKGKPQRNGWQTFKWKTIQPIIQFFRFKHAPHWSRGAQMRKTPSAMSDRNWKNWQDICTRPSPNSINVSFETKSKFNAMQLAATYPRIQCNTCKNSGIQGLVRICGRKAQSKFRAFGKRVMQLQFVVTTQQIKFQMKIPE